MDVGMEQQFSPKDPRETYDVCFDYSRVLKRWERLLKKKTKISVIDMADNSDVTDMLTDSSKNHITRKKVYLRVKGGEIGHRYRFLTEVLETNKGTRLAPLTGVMKIESN